MLAKLLKVLETSKQRIRGHYLIIIIIIICIETRLQDTIGKNKICFFGLVNRLAQDVLSYEVKQILRFDEDKVLV